MYEYMKISTLFRTRILENLFAKFQDNFILFFQVLNFHYIELFLNFLFYKNIEHDSRVKHI